jgi:hypothetical protein
LIEKSKVSDRVPMTTETLHAKRAASALEGFIDENGGGPGAAPHRAAYDDQANPSAKPPPMASGLQANVTL